MNVIEGLVERIHRRVDKKAIADTSDRSRRTTWRPLLLDAMRLLLGGLLGLVPNDLAGARAVAACVPAAVLAVRVLRKAGRR